MVKSSSLIIPPYYGMLTHNSFLFSFSFSNLFADIYEYTFSEESVFGRKSETQMSPRQTCSPDDKIIPLFLKCLVLTSFELSAFFL